MKAKVYALKRNGEWEVRMTIAPEVDRAFWFGAGSGARGAQTAWLRREALPLGQACLVADLWNETGVRAAGRWFDKGVARRGGDWLRAAWTATSEQSQAENVADQSERDGGREADLANARRQGRISDDELVWLRLERLIEQCGDNGERKPRHGTGQFRELTLQAERWLPGEGGCLSGETAAMAQLAAKLLQGRALLSGEARALLVGAAGPGAESSWSAAIQLVSLLGQARLGGAVAALRGRRADARRRLRCRRCGSGEAQLRRTPCYACGRVCAYCEACLLMGRSRECELLIQGRYESPLENRRRRIVAGHAAELEQQLGRWGLSPAQQSAAAEALRFVERKLDELNGGGWGRNATDQPEGTDKRERKEQGAAMMNNMFLLWAVTGAGKTEMIFPLVQAVLDRGGRALIASPRRDVVIELDPRIRRAFPEAQVVTLYGGSEQRWERGQITLSTTHQLFRFHQSFDLVIVDEIDAFPYHGDPMLHYAADRSGLPGAPKLLLSATPPRRLQLAAKWGRLAHARVPVRYHRHPLPEPKLRRSPSVGAMLAAGAAPSPLLSALRQSLDRGAQCFVFVQRIAQTEALAALLRRSLPCGQVAATSSQDPGRGEKVAQFRRAEIRVLVTTTILERGVTIPRSDVYILDADGRLFDEASLVQMAGRAGRSSDDPYGKVWFFAGERNMAQIRAVRHIRGMNRMARRRGYLLTERRKRG